MSSGLGWLSTGTPRWLACQTSTICSISEMSSKYVRYDLIFPPRKSATVTPANWTCQSGRLQPGTIAEDQRSCVISFDKPLGIRLVAHFIESAEQNDDVGESDFTEGCEGSEGR